MNGSNSLEETDRGRVSFCVRVELVARGTGLAIIVIAWIVNFASPGREGYAHFAVRFWLTDLSKEDPTASTVRIRIDAALRRAGIAFARPHHAITVIPGGERMERRDADRQRSDRVRSLTAIDFFSDILIKIQRFFGL